MSHITANPLLQVANVVLTGLSASVATTTMYTVPVSGTYRLTAYYWTTTVGSAGTVNAGFLFNDGTGANSWGGGNASLTSQVPGAGKLMFTETVFCVAASVIQYDTIVAGNVGGVYSVSFTVERVA